MTISGKAEFKWRNKNKESVKASEVYLKNVVYIFGNEDSDPIDIEAGFHTYRFATTLPLEIPSTFECEFGKIAYKAEAVFVLPWKMNYMKGKANFKVVSYVDLNIDPTLKIPFNTEISRKIGKLFFGYRTLFLKVYTPFTGIVPGHKIKLVFDINNRTKKNVRKMVIKLVQILKLNSGGNTKNTRIIIAERSVAGTPKKTLNQFESDITVPTNLVPVKHSNVICISYQIEVSAKISTNVKKNPKFVIPIEIGTVALNCERTNRGSCVLSLAPRSSFMSKKNKSRFYIILIISNFKDP